MPEEPLDDRSRPREHIDTLRTYFRLLSDLDIEGWIELWAEDCEQVLPYAPSGMPSTVTGRRAVQDLYQQMAEDYSALEFADLELHPMLDPDVVLARWSPRGELRGGGHYRNDNVALFEFDADGRIRRFSEYFNPIPVQQARPGAGR